MAITTLFELTASQSMQDSDGITPTVQEGGGTYSEENGYWSTGTTILSYAKNLSSDIVKGTGYIEFEALARNNGGHGESRDMGIQLRTADSNNSIMMTAVIANGLSDSGATNNEILRVRGDDNTVYEMTNASGSALDVNKNEWLDVKFRVYIENSIWVKGECYIEGVLWQSYDVPTTVSVANWSATLKINLEWIQNCGIKSAKITRNFVDVTPSGGAGSGYIGNALVSNKKMVGYNVPTSDTASTKTESIEEASETPVSGKPKIGNGYVRIKYLRP